MESDNGLINALVLDGAGGGQVLDAAGLGGWEPEQGPLWLHLDRKHPETVRWLEEDSGLDDVVTSALQVPDARPRCTPYANGMIVVFRGVNLNPGAEPDDMISLRMWVDADRVISLRTPKLMAAQDMRDKLAAGTGARTTGELVRGFAASLTERISPVVFNLEERIDDLEELVLESKGGSLRLDLAGVRRQAIALSRYLSPQREAFTRLADLPPSILTATDQTWLRESTNRTARYLEDLAALRERAALVQEEVLSRQSDRMNRTMYVLSLVAAIFLPLGLLTGLLGINVGGMPGVESPAAFWSVCVLLVVLAVVEYYVLRWWKML